MKKTKLSVAIKATLIGASIMLAPNAFAVDKELLDMLKANGSISQSQYDQLAAKEDKPTESSEMLKKMAWAEKIKIKGDLRVRNENRSTTNDISDKGRQRYRARVGIYADVTDNVQAGIRLASGDKEGPTSTNETLGDDFDKDEVWLDLAYINWSPVEGLDLTAGKFKQPWETISGGLVWDSDVNPEGLAASYEMKLGGATMIGTGGYLLLEDGGSSSSNDSNINFAQLAAKFKVLDAKTKVGASIYDYSDGSNPLNFGKGNDSDQYQLTELFGEMKFKPFKLYGQYVVNNDADGVNSGEDTAWLLGVGTKMGKWKASYDYRETDLNAVYGAFSDSDFADGYTDSKGSRFKLAYEIDKNFTVSTTYIAAEMGDLTSKGEGDVDTWQIDVKAKF